MFSKKFSKIFWPQKHEKTAINSTHNQPPTFLQESCTTKSLLIQDWVFRLGFNPTYLLTSFSRPWESWVGKVITGSGGSAQTQPWCDSKGSWFSREPFIYYVRGLENWNGCTCLLSVLKICFSRRAGFELKLRWQFCMHDKGQIMSECIYEIIDFPR